MFRYGSKGSVLALAVSLLFFASCMTAGNREYRAAERDYDAGNYVGATENAVKALQANDEHDDAPGLLRRALPKATSQLQEQISQAKASSEEFPYERAVSLYERLVKLHSDVNDLRMGFSTENFSAQLGEARQVAAEARYQAGIAALAAGGFENARVALAHFRTVGNYVQNYQDTADLIAQAENASMARLYVYVNDAEGEIASRLGQRLMGDNDLARVTDLVPAGTLGVGARQNASTVLAAARAQGVDLLLYVGIDSLESDMNPLEVTEKRIHNVAGAEVTASYSVSALGQWQIYDVASGSVRSEDNLRVSVGESLKFDSLVPVGQAEVNFADGSRSVIYADLSEMGLISYMGMVRRTRDFMDSVTADVFRNMTLTEMTEKLDRIVLHGGIYGFKVEEISPSTGAIDPYDVVHAYVSKMNEILHVITGRASKLDELASQAVYELPGEIEAAVARAALAPLRQ